MAARSPLEIRTEAGRTLTLIGEVDLASAPQLQQVLARLLATEGDIVLNMGPVSFIDVSGAHILAEALDRLGQHRLIVMAPTRIVRRLLDLTGLSGRPNLEIHLGPRLP